MHAPRLNYACVICIKFCACVHACMNAYVCECVYAHVCECMRMSYNLACMHVLLYSCVPFNLFHLHMSIDY